jgi:cytochrome c-type protein NapB
MSNLERELTMKRVISAVLGVMLLAWAAVSHAQQAGAADAPKSMRGADAAAAETAFAEKAYLGKKPGLQKPIERTFKEQPPLVPHAMNNFDEITLEENQCLSCHSLEKAKEKNAPKIGDSHLAKEGGKQVVSMSRYQCTTCHVAQVDASPLVENAFVGNLPPVKK